MAPQGAIELIQAAIPGKKPINDWTWVIVRAVLHDVGLMRFDSQFDVTMHPCDFLWGPGSITDALAWAGQELPQGDTTEVLDRLFAIQYQDDRLYLPRRPEIMLALPETERSGKWYLIRADDPEIAFMHVRNIVIGGQGCSGKGACHQCAAETVRKGIWKDVTTTLAEIAQLLQPLQLPDVRVTSRLRWPRYRQIRSDGTWTLGDR